MSEQIAKLNIEEKLIACIEMAQKRQDDIRALRAENARLKAAICDIWNGHGLCEDHGQLGYWKLGKYIDLAIALQPERGTP